jgi:hypothetical protein
MWRPRGPDSSGGIQQLKILAGLAAPRKPKFAMAVALEDFRHLISDDVARRFDPLVQSWPKWAWDRSGWSQLAMAAVSAVMAAVCLVVSIRVIVSDKPDEQLAFQQAMWGFAGVAGGRPHSSAESAPACAHRDSGGQSNIAGRLPLGRTAANSEF